MQIGEKNYSLYSYYSSLRQNAGEQNSGGLPLPFSAPADSGSTPMPADLTSSSSFSNALWLSLTAKDLPPEAQLQPTSSSDASLLDEFSKWANMSPAERIRAQYLESHHMSEGSLAAMSPDERKQIEDEIAQEVKRQLGINDDNGDTQMASAAPESSEASMLAAE